MPAFDVVLVAFAAFGTALCVGIVGSFFGTLAGVTMGFGILAAIVVDESLNG